MTVYYQDLIKFCSRNSSLAHKSNPWSNLADHVGITTRPRRIESVLRPETKVLSNGRPGMTYVPHCDYLMGKVMQIIRYLVQLEILFISQPENFYPRTVVSGGSTARVRQLDERSFVLKGFVSIL